MGDKEERWGTGSPFFNLNTDPNPVKNVGVVLCIYAIIRFMRLWIYTGKDKHYESG